MQIAACGTAWPARHALALALASEQFLWGVAAVAQVLRILFDPALGLAAQTLAAGALANEGAVQLK